MYVFLFTGMVVLVGSCKDKAPVASPKEDFTAKKMLQGIWLNYEEQDVAFEAKGDTIFYPDSTSQPVYFQIIGDSLVLHGSNEVRYPIVKQAPHLFAFRNQTGDLIKLEKSEDPNDRYAFSGKRPVSLNQNKLIKRDTVVTFQSERYHCYVQINPTTYKVVKPTYNDDGVEVDNVYYDNIIHLSIFHGPRKVFSSDFHKQDFRKQVPQDYLKQGILSDFIFTKIDAHGVHYTASIAVPDSQVSFQVKVRVDFNGRLTMMVL